MHAEHGDLTFACVDSKKDGMEVELRAVIAESVQKAMGIEGMKEIIGQAKRKKVVIVDKTPMSAKEEMQNFIRLQVTLNRIQDIKDTIAIIEVLKLNQLEKNKQIYQGLSVFELVSHVYTTLTNP